jgi:hypothetical protein
MARECDQLAQHAPEPEIRQRFVELAIKWRELAAQVDMADRPDRSKLH